MCGKEIDRERERERERERKRKKTMQRFQAVRTVYIYIYSNEHLVIYIVIKSAMLSARPDKEGTILIYIC